MLLHAKRLLTNWRVKTRPTDLAEIHLRFIAAVRSPKRCAKAAPDGMNNAANVQSIVALSTQVDRNAFLRIAKSARHPALRHPD